MQVVGSWYELNNKITQLDNPEQSHVRVDVVCIALYLPTKNAVPMTHFITFVMSDVCRIAVAHTYRFS